ncbi:hypothetical protein HC762_01080 [bacterium]|nr:hypothetical protein [bacterium]
MLGRSLGWATTRSVFLGAVVAMSSTTIIAKAFAEQSVTDHLRQMVVGVLVMEDAETGEQLVVVVERAVGEDVDLGAGEDRDRLPEVRAGFFDLVALRTEALDTQPVGLHAGAAVIGDGDGVQALSIAHCTSSCRLMTPSEAVVWAWSSALMSSRLMSSPRATSDSSSSMGRSSRSSGGTQLRPRAL